MSEATKAVFLSYAREDTDAARRIAEALRSHGVEVWFDQNELRGGDAWDQKIRRQIGDCTLFIPIISQHTQDRNKGYFRLEWKLAVEQTHLLLEGVPFLAPVVVDETPDAHAAVPAEFLRVQWTRLPGALPTPQFVEQIKRLLNASVTPDVTAPPMPMRPAPVAPTATPVATPAAKSGFPTAIVAAIGVVVLGAVGYFALRPAAKEPAASAKPTVETKASVAPPAAPVPVVNDKSIAVLPFTNMSEDKDANAFFADGVHEEILTDLALISELRVVSRTSVEQYRNTTKSIPQIARELGVAWILEGSVFRAGNKVRVTGQLIRAAADQHVWAKSYDRDLTDIFAIQAELAQTIASSLAGALSPHQKKLLERRPTENLAAYDLYLKARDAIYGSSAARPERYIMIEPLLQAAVTLDPNFAFAWAELAHVHSDLWSNFSDRSPVRLAKAKTAIDTAIRLAPDAPEIILNLGDYYYHCERDYPRAVREFEKLIQVQPNSAEAYAAMGFVQRRQGRWAEALGNFRRAVELDQAYADVVGNLVTTLIACRDYDEAIAMQRRMVNLAPSDLSEAWRLVVIPFLARGSMQEVTTWLANLPGKDGVDARRRWAYTRGDLAGYLQLDRGASANASEAAIVLAAQGNLVGARSRLQEWAAQLKTRLVTEPENPLLWASLARAQAITGNAGEAMRSASRAVELEPEARDAFSGPRIATDVAFVYAWTGDKDRAITAYARLLRVPVHLLASINVHIMRLSPEFAPLRADPRFEALLNDPKNNEPLF